MNKLILSAWISIALAMCGGSPVYQVAAAPAAAAQSAPEIVTLDGILNPDTDSAPVFAPDGNTAYFDRTNGAAKSVVSSRHVHGRWTPAQVAPFSGRYFDQDPVISHDGSFLIFASDRPVPGTSHRIVQSFFRTPAPGSNLWRVELKKGHWGPPEWLGPDLNQSAFTDFPDLAADNSLYFINPEHGMHTFRSQYRSGKYLAPVEVNLGDAAVTTHDPAVAPDESFIVFNYGKTKGGLGRLCIAFKEGDHWGEPIDFGNEINADSPAGARLAPDGRTIYFSGSTHIWKLSLAPWLASRK